VKKIIVVATSSLASALSLIGFSSRALAHEGTSLPYGSFMAGVTHPVLGMDHFLAMVSVGVLSAQIGGRAIWTVPATFVSVMAVGGLLGIADVGLIGIEVGIAVSVLVLGSAIAVDKRLPAWVAMLAVGLFAIFHGYAHGGEMPDVAEPVRYAVGFLTGTAALHITGLVIGDISQHYERGKLVLRIAGVIIAILGGVFLASALGYGPAS
jgi:urease accessory protein